MWLQFGTLIVAMVGVAGGLRTLHQGNRQQMLELGNRYIKRYWEIDDDLLTSRRVHPNICALAIATCDSAKTNSKRQVDTGSMRSSGTSGMSS